jgi:acyl carrier protein
MDRIMNVSAQRVQDIVYQCLDELNEQLAEGHRIEKRRESSLLGDAGGVDSLGFVNFIALLEEKCEVSFHVSLSLSDTVHEAEANPFETIGTLVDFITRLLEQTMLKTGGLRHNAS